MPLGRPGYRHLQMTATRTGLTTNADGGPPRDEDDRRERLAERIANTLDVPMAGLGLVFLVVVMIESFSRPRGAAGVALAIAGWTIWALFVSEFVLRLAIAPSVRQFLRRNWWQLLFLALPFLRGVRLARLFRVARTGRVVSSAVRTSRSAARALTTRVAWVVVVHVVVVVSSAQLLVEFTSLSPLDALYLAARAAAGGESFGLPDPVARIIEIALTTYAVVIFAALAGTLGAFLLERQDRGMPTGDSAD